MMSGFLLPTATVAKSTKVADHRKEKKEFKQRPSEMTNQEAFNKVFAQGYFEQKPKHLEKKDSEIINL